MTRVKNQTVIFAAMMLAAGLAAAADVQVRPEVKPAASGDTTIHVRSDEGSSCSAPVVGACGTCTISCPVGKAAVCKPGLVVGSSGSGQASCLEPPACLCR